MCSDKLKQGQTRTKLVKIKISSKPTATRKSHGMYFLQNYINIGCNLKLKTNMARQICL